MGGKLNVYNLGEKGVNVTKTPLHHEDGELLSAQNAEFYAEAGKGGLRKRPGLQRINSIALAGSVAGVIGVPLPGPGQRAVFVSDGSATPAFQKTTDGTTWAAAEGFVTTEGSSGSTYTLIPHTLAAHLLNQFFYAAEDGTTGILLGYDGVTEYEVVRFLNVFNITVLGTFQGKILLSELVSGGASTRVWLVDPVAGTMEQIGSTLAVEVYAGVGYLGKIWIGTAEGGGAKISSARVGDTGWTAERTAASMQAVMSLAHYNGELYAAYAANAGTAAIVEKRTTAGVWSTVRTGSHSTDANRFDGLQVHQSVLYAMYDRLSGAPAVSEIHANTAGVWSVSKDLGAEGEDYTKGRVSVGSSLFVAANGGIWRKVGAGAWSKVFAVSLNAGGGMMAVI